MKILNIRRSYAYIRDKRSSIGLSIIGLPGGPFTSLLADSTPRKEEPLEFFAAFVSNTSDTYHGKTETKIVEVERELTWWQQTKMRGFWVLLAVIVFVFRKNIVALARRFI